MRASVQLAKAELIANVTPCSSKQFKNNFISPELIRPYPKAAARKEYSNRGRKRGRCMIAADTPKKALLVEKARQKEESS